jgi:hypothetical protein
MSTPAGGDDRAHELQSSRGLERRRVDEHGRQPLYLGDRGVIREPSVGVGLRARSGDADLGDDVGALPRERLDVHLAGERSTPRT